MSDQAQTIINVPLNSIRADYDWNCRKIPSNIDAKGKFQRGITELASQIKKESQLNPLIVLPLKDGTYQLVAGFRRYAALKMLGDRPALVTVIDNMDSREAAYVNLTENAARRDLHPYEIARALSRLSEQFGESETALAKRLPIYSKSYIGNCVRAFKRLHPTILKAWEEQDDRCTTDNVVRWQAMDRQEQIERWQHLLDHGVETGSEINASVEKGDASPSKIKRATARKIDEAIEACKTIGTDLPAVQGALAALQFAAGYTKRIIVTTPKGEAEIYDSRSKSKDKGKNKDKSKDKSKGKSKGKSRGKGKGKSKGNK